MCVMYICYLRRIWISQHLRFCYLFWTCFSFHCKDKKRKRRATLISKRVRRLYTLCIFFYLICTCLHWCLWLGVGPWMQAVRCPLHKEYWAQVLAGNKTWEFRAIGRYWKTRLEGATHIVFSKGCL